MLVLNYSTVAGTKLIPSVMDFTDGEIEAAKAMASQMRDDPKFREVSLYQYNVSRSGARRQVAVDPLNTPKMKGVRLWNGAEVVELVKLPATPKVKAAKPRKAPVASDEDISASLVEKPRRSRRKAVAKALSNA